MIACVTTDMESGELLMHAYMNAEALQKTIETDKGFPPLPKAMIKERWKTLKLNGTIQLTISGCLGPCDLANVAYVLANEGTGQWFGGLSELWQYETLIQWANECRQSSSLLPIPATLEVHRFDRFASIPNSSPSCVIADRKVHEST